MAELLIRAKKHWMDDFKQDDIDKMSKEQRQSYEARSQIGDIIVVRPDGWVWGKEECLPNFIVVKLPQISYDSVKQYEQTLTKIEGTGETAKVILLKRRKFRIPETWVNANKQDVITITLSSQKEALINSIITKNS